MDQQPSTVMASLNLKESDGTVGDPKNASLSVKNLYAITGRTSKRHIRWSEYATAEDEEKELQRLTSGFDVIHRLQHMEDENDITAWQTHSILIRGDLKQGILTKALTGYPEVDLSKPEIEFKPPFAPLVHRWEDLQKHAEKATASADASVSVDRNAELLDILKKVVASGLTALERVKVKGQVDFDDL